MMGQADRVAGTTPDDDFSGIESPPRHVRWVVETVEGRTRASLAVVGRKNKPVLRLHVAGAVVRGVADVLNAVVQAKTYGVACQIEQAIAPVAGASVLRRSSVPERGGDHFA